MNENEYENKSSDDEQPQQTKAESYANVVQTNLSRNCIPPDVQDPNDSIYYKVHLWKQTLKSELTILLTPIVMIQ